MLVRSLLSKLTLNFTFSCAFSQVAKHPLVASQFFQVGPRSINANKPMSKLFNTTFSQIEKLEALLQQKSQRLFKKFKLEDLNRELSVASEQKKEIKQYLQAYGSLMQAIQKSRIENQQTYNIIGWYNMLPLKRNLIEKMFACKPEELPPIIQSLSWMNSDQDTIQQYFQSKEDYLQKSKKFFRKLPFALTIHQLKKIDEIIKPSCYLSQRKFYQVYLRTNIENILRDVQLSENESFGDDIVWLLDTSIKAMNDSDLGISKIEKFLLSWRPKLKQKSIERLMNVYSDIGKVNPFIYEQYIKPFILKHNKANASRILHTFRFIVCSQVEDKQIMRVCYQKLNSENIQKVMSESQLSELHTYSHYLALKGQKTILSKSLQKKMQEGCKQENCISYLNIIILRNKNNKVTISKMKKSNNKYISDCLQDKNDRKIKKIDDSEKDQFKEDFCYQLPGMNFPEVEIFKNLSFCNYTMDYFLNNRVKNELINVETDCETYIFNSGQIKRQIAMRQEVLEHYGIKVKYMNSQRYEMKERKLSEQQSIMGAKVPKKKNRV